MLHRLLVALFFLTSLHAEEPTLPPEAVAVLTTGTFQPTQPKPEEGSITRIEGAWRLASPGKLEKSYNLSVSRSFTQPIAQAQVCLFVLKARTVESEARDGKGRVTAAIQNNFSFMLRQLCLRQRLLARLNLQ